MRLQALNSSCNMSVFAKPEKIGGDGSGLTFLSSDLRSQAGFAVPGQCPTIRTPPWIYLATCCLIMFDKRELYADSIVFGRFRWQISLFAKLLPCWVYLFRVLLIILHVQLAFHCMNYASSNC
mgnify:CR=1 FL=1